MMWLLPALLLASSAFASVVRNPTPVATPTPLPLHPQLDQQHRLAPRQVANASASVNATISPSRSMSISIPNSAASVVFPLTAEALPGAKLERTVKEEMGLGIAGETWQGGNWSSHNGRAGGLTYTRPAVTDAISYYKIASNNPITFGWNYTNLYVTPSMLTFEARCSANSFTYPVGPTTGIPGDSSSIVWDPYQYAQSANAIPFAQASYTLRVYDERGPDAAATAGYFNGANSIVNFALYSPAAYTPLASGWKCVTCSFATLSTHLAHPLLVALPITIALILIGGAGVFNR